MDNNFPELSNIVGWHDLGEAHKGSEYNIAARDASILGLLGIARLETNDSLESTVHISEAALINLLVFFVECNGTTRFNHIVREIILAVSKGKE